MFWCLLIFDCNAPHSRPGLCKAQVIQESNWRHDLQDDLWLSLNNTVVPLLCTSIDSIIIRWICVRVTICRYYQRWSSHLVIAIIITWLSVQCMHAKRAALIYLVPCWNIVLVLYQLLQVIFDYICTRWFEFMQSLLHLLISKNLRQIYHHWLFSKSSLK